MSSSRAGESGKNIEEDPNQVYHPDSKWQEPPSEFGYLTYYDLHRIPRPVKDSNLRLVLPIKQLNSEFICPICLGYMRKTSLVMECLHRFCDECIQKCLRLLGKKECPSCRIHIPSRRSLRRDPEFDALMKHILGDVTVLEAQEEREAKLQVKRNKVFAMTRKRGMVNQADLAKMRRSRLPATKENSLTLRRLNAEKSALSENVAIKPEIEMDLPSSPLIEIVLIRHPDEQRLQRLHKDLLKLSGEASISVLQAFLSSKLSYEPAINIVIMVQYHGDCIALDETMLLKEIDATGAQKDHSGEHIMIYYRSNES
mmetsp:Transcript_24092/g.35693  ORF Transcript_24092/g.35693 Transcript_24092/m.35693 type:complete len:313 (-) Transcript_24092:643-1581(-)|eukprot:CAMPEP_0194227036 /NCGR_PEP_ID=MMETSP0156-20130528/42653_1 /TAXON_ID=33649 /ORGANISM="Thalassionema nitzschioides, Strain L26-B" /LENGTH=312 /DNA_ID=CAMNT_0038959509 /DNA_START=120 /DNA_END=1058 /DNA_ORIENTATION=-